MSRNIELFDEYASRILADLYAAFPIEIGLDASKISGVTNFDEFGGPADTGEIPAKAFEVALGTIRWLQDSGYIRSRHELTRRGLTGAVLTANGLAVLKSVPKSVSPQTTLGDRLIKIAQSGATEAAKEAVKAVLATGIAMVTPAMV